MKKTEVSMPDDLFREINVLIAKNADLWANRSHFIRSAVIRQVRSYKKGEIR